MPIKGMALHVCIQHAGMGMHATIICSIDHAMGHALTSLSIPQGGAKIVSCRRSKTAPRQREVWSERALTVACSTPPCVSNFRVKNK